MTDEIVPAIDEEVEKMSLEELTAEIKRCGPLIVDILNRRLEEKGENCHAVIIGDCIYFQPGGRA
jgi:hypothetical protein